ncbi:protein NRT1/ PTR FAMILY 2.9-like [Impatiens glandulifera]|uniref:protein NRT1/ PTR FAMILY 2.9-like n=1 Tax=Impatiens glandulifera TaxID=253017 RepID=UPI001FB04B3B|nr:protein NRT1/ PTR FAMILY 2.9-like [Impatiens glandulifera]
MKMENIISNNEKEETKIEPKYRGIKAMPFIIGNEAFEKLGTMGTSSNLLVYLTTVFNMKSITALNIINIFHGTCNFATIIGAFLSDTYFGRYTTLGFASISSFLGMMILTMTAAFTKLHPPTCGHATVCTEANSLQMGFLISTFAFLVIGAGGIRPCNLAFGADQFDPRTESGKRGISSFFNWYYFTFTFAVMVSLTVIVYVQSDISWSIGFAIPTFLMLLSCIVFFIATKIYVRVRPQGSPLTSVLQVIVAAIRKRSTTSNELHDHVPKNSLNSNLPHTNQFKCLDAAAVIYSGDKLHEDGSAMNAWRLCSVQQVEQVKCLLRIFPIWISCIIFAIAMVQQQTYTVFQALQSDRRLGKTFNVPAASYSVFSMIALTIWIPIYDRIIVPSLRNITKKEDGISLLQKIGIGMFLAVLTMFVSGIVERQRRVWALTKPTLGIEPRKGEISSLSALWLVPQLVLGGLAEAFTSIGQIEFYYKQFPENMRSIAGSFMFCGLAFSSYLSSFLISVVHRVTMKGKDGQNWLDEDLNKGRLDYFYFVVAGLQVLNLGYFMVCAKWYKYKATNANGSQVELESIAV